MSEQFVGEIKLFSGNFEPRDWAFCNGQLLPISEYQALFSVIGTTYGGDGRSRFALPDLRGRAPLHAGEGPGLARQSLGEQSCIKEGSTSDGKKQGFLAVNYIIALDGIFPRRN